VTHAPAAPSEPLAVASFGRRLAALIVDCLLSVGVAALFSRPDPPGLLGAVVFFVSYTLFLGLFAQSPGMRLLGLRCVRTTGDGRIGIPRAALRTALLQLVVPAVLTDSRGRAWHDRAAESAVVRA
jgi:uncharacterized RDD family membrane protein YckC